MDCRTCKYNTYRNYYCTPLDGVTAKRFKTLGLRELTATINDGRDGIYSVTDAGMATLKGWLLR